MGQSVGTAWLKCGARTTYRYSSIPTSFSLFVHSIWWRLSGSVGGEKIGPREIAMVIWDKGYGATLAGQVDVSRNKSRAEGSYERPKYRCNYSGG